MDMKLLLVQRMLQMLSVKEELADYVAEWADRISDPQLQERIHQALPEFTRLTGNLLRGLKLLDAPIDDVPTTALVAAYGYDDLQVTPTEEMPPPAADLHFITTMLAIGGMEVAFYQAMLEMARELGAMEVEELLQENMEHDQRDMTIMQEELTRLLILHPGRSQAA